MIIHANGELALWQLQPKSAVAKLTTAPTTNQIYDTVKTISHIPLIMRNIHTAIRCSKQRERQLQEVVTLLNQVQLPDTDDLSAQAIKNCLELTLHYLNSAMASSCEKNHLETAICDLVLRLMPMVKAKLIPIARKEALAMLLDTMSTWQTTYDLDMEKTDSIVVYRGRSAC